MFSNCLGSLPVSLTSLSPEEGFEKKTKKIMGY